MSGGGRHVARREDDKCASYGSLFIGQSSGTQVETENGRRKAGGAEAGGRWDEIRFRFLNCIVVAVSSQSLRLSQRLA